MTGLDILIHDAEHSAQTACGQRKNDYVCNGLLHCGSCRTPKQVRISVFGTVRIVHCLCRCEEEQQAAAENAFRADQKRMYITRLRDVGIQDARLLGSTFDASDDADSVWQRKCVSYCDHWQDMLRENMGMYLFGSAGTGKTYLAGCIANRLIDDGVPCVATSFSRLIKQIFAADDKNALINNIVSCAFLIIDDFGAENDSGYNNEQIYAIIDERYKTKKPLILTSNIPYRELTRPKTVQQTRIYSRIVEMCQPVEVQGGRRLKIGMEKAKCFNKILGV